MICPGPCCMTEADRRLYYVRADRTEARAQALLLNMLNETQRHTYYRFRRFQVQGSHGTLYRIHTAGYSGNVYWLRPSGRSGGQFCGHSDYDRGANLMLPASDHYLAQMLSLVADEISWLNVACLQDGDYPPSWHFAVKGEVS